jgi:G3E family GTPase
VSCALREDVVPTLERLGRDDRWGSIVAGLPTATEATHLARLLARDHRLARHLELASIVNAMGTEHLVEDLLSDELLRERGLHTSPDDDRGTGEVACAQVEFADVLVLDDDAAPPGIDLVRALARPDSVLVTGADQLEGSAITAQRHRTGRTTSWSSPESEIDVPLLEGGQAWRLALRSPRAFHPERLLDQIERLGTGRHRSRGCFWVPTRPDTMLEWSGAGGQLSIGTYGPWGRRAPLTRLVFTGLGTAPPDLGAAFEDIVLTAAESRQDQHAWKVGEDGLEAWLGDIRDVA